MKNLLKSKAALSTVVTTLIILVVSVLLASVVAFYAINVTTTRVQEESLQITKLHTWHDGTEAVTAFYMVNTGGRDVVLQKIAVRGIAADMATDVYWCDPGSPFTDELIFVATADLVGETVGAGTLAAATSNLILASGDSIVIYIADPGQVSVNDIGVTLGVTIFTANAQYYKESNVEAGA